MNKNIFIVRHGHADFSSEKDFDRVLTMKGIKAVNQTAEFINKTCKDLGISISRCISSSANRTKQTSEIICFKCGIENNDFYKELYSTSASSWIDRISKSTDENILIVGHNPTFSQLISTISGKDVYMHPANCALISLEIKSDGIIFPAQLRHYFNNE